MDKDSRYRDSSKSFVSEGRVRQGCPISPLLFSLYIDPLCQWIRQSEVIKGIKEAAIEQKVELLADDILVYLKELEKSFIGSFIVTAGYIQVNIKLSLLKTQLIGTEG